MSVSDLRALAKERGVDTARARTKAQLLERLKASEPAAAGAGADDRAVLEGASLKNLKSAAEAFGVAVKGSRKNAFVEGLAKHPRAGEIAAKVAELEGIRRDTRELEAVGKEIEAIAREAVLPDVRDPETDPLLESALRVSPDFAAAEDLLDVAHRRFEERHFDKAVLAAEEAVTSARQSYDTFLGGVWAHGILSAQQLILDAAKAGQNVERATAVLLETKRAFRGGRLDANRDLLVKLGELTRALYSDEMLQYRNALFEKQQAVRQAANLGAAVGPAEDLLAEATRTAATGDQAKALELASRAEALAQEAVRAREEAVRRQLESVARAVDATKRFGTDVTLAEESLTMARRALESGQLLTASELVTQAEMRAQQAIQARAAGIAPPAVAPAGPIPTAVEPGGSPPSPEPAVVAAPAPADPRAETARRVLTNIAPILDEADLFRIDASAGRLAVTQAQNALTLGDAENALAGAKRAEEHARSLLGAIIVERQKRGITRPTQGICGRCNGAKLDFYDDGWGRCSDCGNVFRWRQLEAPRKLFGGLFKKR